MFRNREHAGEQLAGLLEGYRGRARTVALALPRGGVPVAAVVARSLGVALDILPVRKIGAPAQPELAIGAVAAGGVLVLDERAVAAMHIAPETIAAAIGREREELLRRERLYRGERPPAALKGQTVILIDDGLATGYTMLAAIRAVRGHTPERVVVAVPVAPPSTLHRLRDEADEVVCVHSTENLSAVGQFYEDFGQVSDEAVRDALGGG